MIVTKTSIKGLKKDGHSVTLVNRVLTIQVKNSFLVERIGAVKIINTTWASGLSPRATVDIETSHGEITLEVTRAEYNALRGASPGIIGQVAHSIRTALGCNGCRK